MEHDIRGSECTLAKRQSILCNPHKSGCQKKYGVNTYPTCFRLFCRHFGPSFGGVRNGPFLPNLTLPNSGSVLSGGVLPESVHSVGFEPTTSPVPDQRYAIYSTEAPGASGGMVLRSRRLVSAAAGAMSPTRDSLATTSGSTTSLPSALSFQPLVFTVPMDHGFLLVPLDHLEAPSEVSSPAASPETMLLSWRGELTRAEQGSPVLEGGETQQQLTCTRNASVQPVQDCPMEEDVPNNDDNDLQGAIWQTP